MADSALTDRQRDILEQLQDKGIKEVAAAIGVTDGAIYSAIKRIRSKDPALLPQWAHLDPGDERSLLRKPTSRKRSTRVASNGAPANSGGPEAVTRARDAVTREREQISTRMTDIETQLTALQSERDELSTALTELDGMLAKA